MNERGWDRDGGSDERIGMEGREGKRGEGWEEEEGRRGREDGGQKGMRRKGI